MNPKEDEIDSSADISNPRETQGILAIEVTTGAIVVAGIATVATIIRGGDPTPYVSSLVTMALGVIGFYFGSKKVAEAA